MNDRQRPTDPFEEIVRQVFSGRRLVFLGDLTADPAPDAPTRSLAERVADDLAAILPADLGPAMPELPERRDLSAYDAALAAAIRTCPHDVVEQPLHGRAEVDCLDCGRHLTATEYVRERRERSR